MAKKRMGFEGLIYYGAAGTTGSNLLQDTRDITETFDTEKGATTIRGAGTSPPIKTSRVTARGYGIEWNMTYREDDTFLLALIAAAVAGNPVAIRTKAFGSGLGFDGDMNLSWKWGKPLAGEQTVDFTADPNDDNRAPQLNV